MALFNIIKYEGGRNVLAWKHPNTELNTGTQLIVNESQEVVLLKNGKACDVFGPGKHILETANIPILRGIVNIPFGGQSPFKAEIWYVNRINVLDVLWGTPTPIQLQDPKYSVFVPVRAFGQFGIQVDDSRKFLVKLVGVMRVFTVDNVVEYFRGMYLTKIKDVISSYIIHKKISVLEINAYILEISNYLREKISLDFEEYGIKLASFNVNDMNVSEDDPTVKQLKNALSKKAEMTIIGYNYQQERSFDTLNTAASNQAAGGFMAPGLGLGMGVAMGQTMGNQFASVAPVINTNAPNMVSCPKCGSLVQEGKKFCPDCGYDMQKKNVAENNQDTFTCAQCGAKISRNKRFCFECGKKYNPCPKCGEDMPLDEKSTCPSCGYGPEVLCPSCGKPLHSPKARFCSECGFEIKE